MKFNVAVQNALAVNAVSRLVRRLGDFSPVLKEFHAYHAREVDSVFDALAQGGTHRGLTWQPWPESALPHRRKDGTGMTLGRKRPSGQRVGPQSRLNDDTGALRADIRRNLADRTRARMTYGTDLEYAPAVLAHRQPFSITPADAAKLAELTAKSLQNAFRGLL